MNTFPIDLFKIYKGFYQRSYRSPEDGDYAGMTQISEDIIKRLFLNQSNPKELDEIRLEGIDIAKILLAMEMRKGGLGRFYSLALIKALEANNFEINVPYQVIPRWQENNYFGCLYVLTSNVRPDQCKLGATYMDIDTRVAKYISKFGYQVEVYFSRNDVLNPFTQELIISNKYRDNRFSGNTPGDSNEWFYLYPETLQNEILSIAE